VLRDSVANIWKALYLKMSGRHTIATNGVFCVDRGVQGDRGGARRGRG
jgi:hypothetical protein